ncbi:hypothetical protein IC220_01700, partial [Wolbachia endosymbiont of Pentalonia nigronervosa]|nr:hypothetical protein [Wolbachia endosymbiont of Pentalonia nigronervosa]
MHNIDDRHDISDYIVKKLDKLANSTTRFKKEFNNLIPYHKERYTYIKTVEKKNAQAMSGVLNATKDVRIFDGLLESDKKFAFNTLDCVNSQCTLFKTLFSKLGQHREKYIKHVKGKKNSAVAMSGILNATKDTSIFDGLLKSDKEFAFNTLDCVSPQYTLFKTLFDKLRQHRRKYIQHIQGKKNTKAMSGVLNVTKDTSIFNGLLKGDKEFAFNTLDCINPTYTLFKTLFDKLGQHREEYIKHVKGKKNGAVAMSGILNATKDANIFNYLLKSDKEFAFNTLDCVSPQYTLFKTLFDKLGQYREKYIKHIQGKKNAKAMSGVLNVTKDTSIFNGLLKSDKEFAFNTLGCINPTHALFKTLFGKLGKQHKNGYVKHV